MKRFLLAFLVIAITLACGSTTPNTPIPTNPPEEQQPIPTIPPPPTATPLPPTSLPTAATGQFYAWNFIASQNSGGVNVEIARFVLAEKTAAPQDFGLIEAFNDRPVVAEIIFRISNSTDKKISIYPDQGTVVAGSEQIELLDFFLASFGDTFSGDIFPGVTVIGGMWFGFKRTPIEEITTVTINFLGPFDENFNTVGPDINIVLDLSTRQNQPLPDELK